MKRLLLTLTVLISLLFSAYGFVIPQAFAQTTSFGISLTPPVKYITVPSGQTITTSVALKNTTDAAQTLNLTILDFSADPITGQAVLGKPAPEALIKIKTPVEKTVALRPGESTTVFISITAPSGTQQREYHWSLVATASQLEVNPTTSIGAAVTGGLASNIIVFFGNTPEEKSQLIVDQTSIPMTIDSLQALQFGFSLKNTGPQAVQASGSATITNSWFPSQTQDLDIYPDMVLAGSSRPARNISSSSDTTNPTAQSFSFKKPFHFGIYTISVTLDNPTKETIIIGRVLAFPWSILLILLVGWVLFMFTKGSPLKKVLNYFLPNIKKTSSVNTE